MEMPLKSRPTQVDWKAIKTIQWIRTKSLFLKTCSVFILATVYKVYRKCASFIFAFFFSFFFCFLFFFSMLLRHPLHLFAAICTHTHTTYVYIDLVNTCILCLWLSLSPKIFNPSFWEPLWNLLPLRDCWPDWVSF